MSQSLEDILHQEFDRRVAFCKFQLGSCDVIKKFVTLCFNELVWVFA
ncbi:hypothetical protein LINGRAHAP2_LOCUS36857 [Linum grandiflorum]